MCRNPQFLLFANDNSDTNTEMPTIAATKPHRDVEKLAEVVRRLYCYYRQLTPGGKGWGTISNPVYDGGRDVWGRTHKPVWPKIAEHILELNVDPMAYIHAQFVHRGSDYDLLPPNQLHTERATEHFHRVRQTATTLLKNRIDSEIDSLHCDVAIRQREKYTSVDAMERALSSQGPVAVSALIRYCVAAESGLVMQMDFWRNEAFDQYVLRANDYDAVLGDRIPKELREEGHLYLAGILG